MYSSGKRSERRVITSLTSPKGETTGRYSPEPNTEQLELIEKQDSFREFQDLKNKFITQQEFEYEDKYPVLSPKNLKEPQTTQKKITSQRLQDSKDLSPPYHNIIHSAVKNESQRLLESPELHFRVSPTPEDSQRREGRMFKRRFHTERTTPERGRRQTESIRISGVSEVSKHKYNRSTMMPSDASRIRQIEDIQLFTQPKQFRSASNVKQTRKNPEQKDIKNRRIYAKLENLINGCRGELENYDLRKYIYIYVYIYISITY